MTQLLLFSAITSQAFLPATSGPALVLSDSHFFGQSEPVYPTPNGSGIGGWEEAYIKAQTFVSKLTLEEKVNLTGGYASNENGCGGNIASIPRLGFPGLCLQDAGNGVRATDYVNGYPSGIHAGASWNKNLTYNRAYEMGGEFRRKGAHIALGPAMGALGRTVKGGRNWEGFTSDPYLSGRLSGLTVQGIQDQGVIACPKHFIGNEQELNRTAFLDLQDNPIAAISSNIDDATLHELYLWPFQDAIHAGTASIMCAYNRVNNSYSCQNSKLLNGILKDELGFQGFVVSDWRAQHGGVASALAGLDMAMPYGYPYWGTNLSEAVQNGSVPTSRIDDMATRILAAWYQLGQNDPEHPSPGIGIPKSLLTPHPVVDARVASARPVILQSAIEGHVLVKNERNALPLQTPRVLSLFGYDAVAPNINTSDDSLEWFLGLLGSSARFYTCGQPSRGGHDCPPAIPTVPNGTLFTGGGSGATTPAYISAPFDAIHGQAMEDGTQLYWDFRNNNATPALHRHTEAAIVFINAAAGEGVDRPSLRDDFSDGLVLNVAAQCNNTIVVIHNAGIRLVDVWIEHPNVTAVIFAHLPGQDSGRALVDILYGKVSPSGKLPYTVAKNESDYGAILDPIADFGPNNSLARYPQTDFEEGVSIDYRAFDAQGIDPRFEFGFGLSYTKFSFSHIKCNTMRTNLSTYPLKDVIPGGRADLWDTVATVTANVTNVGDVSAQEVAQLYIGIPSPGQPLRQLRGFEKVALKPNETIAVEFELKRRDLSVWDVVAQEWKLILGTDYTVYVGSSSRDTPLIGILRL